MTSPHIRLDIDLIGAPGQATDSLRRAAQSLAVTGSDKVVIRERRERLGGTAWIEAVAMHQGRMHHLSTQDLFDEPWTQHVQSMCIELRLLGSSLRPSGNAA